MFSTSFLDWGLVLLYFGFLAAVWLQLIGRGSSAADYLVAGRRVTLPALVATLVATWYGGILGVGEYSYRYGVSNWLVFGVPYYIGALLFAWLFARKAREAALYTIPDLLDRGAGRVPALIGAIAVFVIAAPSAYILMLGTIFSAMTSLPLAGCVIAAAVFSLFYIHRGGLRAVVVSDQVQFVLMYVGMATILIFLVAQHGGLPFLHQNLPPAHFTWNGGNPASAVLVWYFIALSTLVDPGFWQRAYAARDPQVARRAVLWSVVFWIVFDFMTTATGMYARAVLPKLADPVYAYPALAKITLPPFALGLFYLGMIATVMSTVDSYGFIAGTTIGRDFIWRLRGEVTEERIPRYSKLGLWIACVFATLLALANPTVIGLWHDLGSIVTPMLLLPVAFALLGRARVGPRATAIAMVAPFLVSMTWLLMRKRLPTGDRYPLGLEPIYAGLIASVLAYAAAWAARTRPRAAVLACGLALSLATAAGARAQSPDSTSTDTLRKVVTLPGVQVSTTRTDPHSPFAKSSLEREEIAKRNWGQDTPMALASLPGAYAYSDAGNGIGYSYLSIRGFPQRRISVLIDGVPLNDPESHEVYWIDHPDLLASTSEAQVQRGVGSALYGAASLGGSVNVETSPFSLDPGFTALASYGTFETRRLMIEGNSGFLKGGWNLYGRYSRIQSAGYRELSDTELWSYYFAAKREAGNHSLQLNLFGGPEETHLAYLGVPRDLLDLDRRFNPLTYPGERDHFFEPHYELVHGWWLGPRATFTQTLFYFDGKGYYDEQRFGQELADYRLSPWATTDSTLFPRGYYRDADADGNLDRDAQGRVTVERFDTVRKRWIADHHYGWVPRLRVGHGQWGTLTVGGELRAHDGHHVGTVIGGNGLTPGTEADHRYYDYHPRTLSAGVFGREEYWLPGRRDVKATLDLAWRHQGYFMRGDQFDGVEFDQSYDFALPRLGLTWTPRPEWTAFAAAATSRREPAFRDLYDGEGVGNVPLIQNGEPLIHPERVNDYELGVSWQRDAYTASANLFRMDFRDELVYAGQFNTDLGYPILGNAARSVHQGVELGASARWGRAAAHPSLTLTGNATLGDNHFIEYHEVYGTTPADVVSYDGNAIGFFPAMMGNLSVTGAWHGAGLTAEMRQTGRIYLDNTESKDASIGPGAVYGLRGSYGFGGHGARWTELAVRVINLLDRRYETSGYMDYDASGNLVPQFMPAATRQVLGEVRIEF